MDRAMRRGRDLWHAYGKSGGGLGAGVLVATVLFVSASVSATGPQRQQPPARPQSSTAPVSRTAPSPVRAVSNPGTVAGYVYWDTKAVQHNPPLGCNGLTVTVSVGTPPSGSTPTFEQFKPLGTYSSFTYLNNGSTLAVCAYAVKQVPVGQDLQVQVTAIPTAFSPVVAPATPPTANNPNGPIKIIGGKCNNLPPAIPSPSVLGSHWWTCGDYAYNVNFVLQAPGNPQPLAPRGMGSAVSTLSHSQPIAGTPRSQVLQGLPPAQPLRGGLPKLDGNFKVVSGPQVKNTAALNSSIIAVLKQQKQAGDITAGQILSAPGGGSSTANQSPTVPPVISTPKDSSAPANPPSPSTRVPNAFGPSGLSLLTPQERAFCQQREAQNLGPFVLSVNQTKQGQGVVYSPDPSYNSYSIVGCGFGKTPGSVYLQAGPDGFPGHNGKLLFPVKLWGWTDNAILATLDPNISGELDQSNVTLVVASGTSSNSTASASGGSFYALRGAPILLPSIPQNEASLYSLGSPWLLSPVTNYYGLNGTLGVMRQGLPANSVAGQDDFNLKLLPGFVVDSTQTVILVSDTNSNVTAQSANVNGTAIIVTYPITASGSGSSANYYSLYALKIWVRGPAGIANPLMANQ